MKQILFLLLNFLFFTTAFAQPNPKWERVYAANKSITACLIVENAAQQIALFCTTRDNQLSFTLLNRTDSIPIQETIFDLQKGTIHAVLAIENSYLLAGDIQKNGKHYPTLWRIDEKGTSLQKVLLNIGKDEGRFLDIAQNLQRTIFITGQLNNQFCLLQLDEHLNPKDSFYQTNYAEMAAGKALAINPFGDIFITGYVHQKKQPQLQVWKFDAQGQLIWNKNYGKGDTEGTDILVMDNGDVVVSSIHQATLYNADTYLLRLAPNGRTIWEHSYGGEGNEQGSRILQTPERDFLLAGEIAAFGARTGDVWLNWLDKDTGAPLQAFRKGNHLQDKVTHALRLQNGDYAIATIADEKARLLYYQSSENLCETHLAAGQNARFSPIFDNELAAGDKNYTFKGMLLANTSLEEWNVLVKSKVDGIKAPAELSIGTIRLEARATHAGQYCYYLEKTLSLETGINNIHTTIRKESILLQDSLSIYNLPKRSNLHILSIGIVYGDLNYTDEDARDFAAIFREQEGRLYEKVFTTILNTKEETVAYKIVDKILEVKDNRDSSGVIQPEDVLMIFISSHGEVLPEGKFLLPGSDYRPDNERTHIQFQKEVLDILEKIDCKKILFIDACKSGGAKGNDNPVNSALALSILETVKATPGIATLSSSGNNEFSYEHNDLKNGLFTAALKQAFQQNVTEVDTNSDRIITLSELNAFLQQRVPQLLAKHYNDPTKRQTPTMPRNDLGDSFPIFYINY